MRDEVRKAIVRTLAWFNANPTRWIKRRLVNTGSTIRDTGSECYCFAGRLALELNGGKPISTDSAITLIENEGLSYGKIYGINDDSTTLTQAIERAKTELV